MASVGRALAFFGASGNKGSLGGSWPLDANPIANTSKQEQKA
jgi:hypothetical protein